MTEGQTRVELRRLCDGEQAPEGHGEFCVMTPGDGDARTVFDRSSPEQQEVARQYFKHLTSQKHYAAFQVEPDDWAGTRLDAFNPEATKVIFVPQLKGG